MPAESETLTYRRHCMDEPSDTQVIATILESEFPDFSWYLAELQAWSSYDDFMMERDGYFLGLSWAGENIVQVEISLHSFMRWVDLTGSPCSLQSLDDFAMRRWLRSKYPERRVRLVRPSALSPIGDSGAFLYIPVCLTPVEARKKHLMLVQSDEVSDNILAGVIARECLDNAD
jgi:hypothetical protein